MCKCKYSVNTKKEKKKYKSFIPEDIESSSFDDDDDKSIEEDLIKSNKKNLNTL